MGCISLRRIFAAIGFGTLISPAFAQYSFINVADTTTIAPIGTFSFLNFASISNGVAVFTGYYNNDSGLGIFTGNGGALTTIAKTGDPAPVGTFSFFSGSTISNGTTAFSGHYNSGTGFGIFTGNGGALTTIAKTGDPAPVGTFNFLNTPSISDGMVAFNGGYNTTGGIFTSNGGALTKIVGRGDPAPIGAFSVLGAAPLISGGEVAFWGRYDIGGIDTGGNSTNGIFTSKGGALTTIAKTGDSAPVGALTLLNEKPSISGETVAFWSRYNGYEFFAPHGIFTSKGGALTTIAKTGDPAPLGTFSRFGNPSISGGTVAFPGWYENESANGIFMGNGGALTTVIKQGDMLFGSTITRVSFDSNGYDGTNLVFSYFLTDGRQGVAIASATSPTNVTPELSGLALVVPALLPVALVAMKRRRRSKGAIDAESL